MIQPPGVYPRNIRLARRADSDHQGTSLGVRAGPTAVRPTLRVPRARTAVGDLRRLATRAGWCRTGSTPWEPRRGPVAAGGTGGHRLRTLVRPGCRTAGGATRPACRSPAVRATAAVAGTRPRRRAGGRLHADVRRSARALRRPSHDVRGSDRHCCFRLVDRRVPRYALRRSKRKHSTPRRWSARSSSSNRHGHRHWRRCRSHAM